MAYCVRGRGGGGLRLAFRVDFVFFLRGCVGEKLKRMGGRDCWFIVCLE